MHQIYFFKIPVNIEELRLVIFIQKKIDQIRST